MKILILINLYLFCTLTACASGGFSGLGKSKSDKGTDDSDEEEQADEPVPVSGSYLVCGKADATLFDIAGGDTYGCSAIDYTTNRKNEKCEEFSAIKAFYTDLTTDLVASRQLGGNHYWHFVFKAKLGKTVKSVGARANCLGVLGALSSITTTFIAPNGNKEDEATKQTLNKLAEDIVKPISEDSPPVEVRQRIFVTSATYTGSLGGIYGADQKCAAAAASTNVDGKFVALISDPERAARSAMSGVYDLYSIKDELIAKAGTFFSGGVTNAQITTEFGGNSLQNAWTGTGGNGEYLKQESAQGQIGSCEYWQNSSGGLNGWVGSPAGSSSLRIKSAARPCDSRASLYCVSVP